MPEREFWPLGGFRIPHHMHRVFCTACRTVCSAWHQHSKSLVQTENVFLKKKHRVASFRSFLNKFWEHSAHFGHPWPSLTIWVISSLFGYVQHFFWLFWPHWKRIDIVNTVQLAAEFKEFVSSLMPKFFQEIKLYQ